MIGTMRKHSTWLWSIIIVVVIFAFVIWGTNPGSGNSSRSGIYGSVYDEPVTETQFVDARAEVNLSYYLMYGDLPDANAERRGFDITREIYLLLLRIHLLKEHQIHAGAAAKAVTVNNLINQMRAQQQPVNSLADLEEVVLKPKGFTLEDFDRFLEHRIASRQLEQVVGLCGQLVSPTLVESIWERESKAVTAQAAFFSAADFLNTVDINDVALGTFFTNRMGSYRTPNRIQVSYVAYPISNYLAKADQQLAEMTDLDARVEAEYQRRGTNTFAELTPDQARDQIREEFRTLAATAAASRTAAIFADKLWQQEPMQPSDLETFAAKEGLTVKVTSPFDRSSTPVELDVNAQFTEAAYALTPDEPHGGPIAGESFVYVLTRNKDIPGAVPSFEDVRERVTQEYRLQQATLAAREAGAAFETSFGENPTTSAAFAEACAKANVQPVVITNISRSTPSLPAAEAHVSLGQLKQIIFSTEVGRTSGFTATQEGGFVVHVDTVLPIDETRRLEELPRFTEAVREGLQGDAVNLWFNQKAQEGLLNTPLFQAPPSQVSAPGS